MPVIPSLPGGDLLTDGEVSDRELCTLSEKGLVFVSKQSWKPRARYLMFAKFHLESAGLASGLLTLASKDLFSLL